MRIEEIASLSFEEQLYELAKDLPSGGRLSLREYFEVLEWANLFTVLPADGSKQSGIAYEISGVRYVLFFTRPTPAAELAQGYDGYVASRVRVRELLERVPDGWGVIVDYGTDGEVRVSPDQLTGLSEGIRIKRVLQEATDSWLAETNQRLSREGIALPDRSEKAKTLWEVLNGFRVLPGSRRARRIEWYFAVVADATAANARLRCDALWRGEYVQDPYLSHMSQGDLHERLVAIMTNLMFADRGALPHELDEREWRELYEHVRFEHERRDLMFRGTIPVAERLAAWPRLEAATTAFRGYLGRKGQLIKFGQLKYIEPMLHEGVIRLFPAARYDDPSLLPAQRDDELSRSILLDASKIRVEHTGRDGIRRPIQVTGTARLTAKSRTNFYVWCTSTTFDPRLFDDFKADGCLIIHDAHTFIERILAAMAEVLPHWVGCTSLVHYFDPLRPGNEVLSARHKDFSYAYQREYRFLWDPPNPEIATALLEPIDLRLGNLDDVAAVLKL